MTGLEYLPHRYQCVRSITVFSFYEQKTRIIYQSLYDVPYFPELVVYDFKDALDSLDLVGHNEDRPNYNLPIARKLWEIANYNLTWQNVLQYVYNLVAARL